MPLTPSEAVSSKLQTERSWRPGAGFVWRAGRLHSPEGLVLAAPEALGAFFAEPREHPESALLERLTPEAFTALTRMGVLIPADADTLRALAVAPGAEFAPTGTVLAGVPHVSLGGAIECANGPRLIRAAAPTLMLQQGATERPAIGRVLDHPCAALWDAGDLTAPSWLESYSASPDWRMIALGGDHSITWRALSGMARSGVSVALLHVDAHDDCSPVADPAHDRLNHASFLRFALTRLPVRDALAGVVMVGLRAALDCSSGPSDLRLRRVDQAQAAAALADIGAACVAVTVDVDALDPAIAPAVSHPEPGGLDYPALCDLLMTVEATTPPDYLDIVETADARPGPTSAVAGALLTDIIHRRYGRSSQLSSHPA